ncbi:MAG: ferritin-like domain-containing protein [Cytophagales bacterium]|nr:ferritin-like domain-containing protein [Cytophaga sp.]
MNLLKIIDDLQLDKIDQEEFLKPALRRGMFKTASDFSLKAALTSLPFALFAMPKIVQASTQANTQSVTDTLNFALTLEYLEEAFYKQGLAKSGLIANEDMTIFNQIKKHESSHVVFLKSVLGSSAVASPNFDFGTAFDNYTNFLATAQALEDTGVRAYKGQAGNLVTNKVALTAALQIHSVEARHASEVRRLRALNGWIGTNESGATYGAGEDANFPAEGNVIQGGVDLSIFASADVTMANIAEAFDEPLDKNTVFNIAKGFIVP